jgi:3-deoxy-manno-octulosonate cytidylyltransferase (CMP-KDO synthetase)
VSADARRDVASDSRQTSRVVALIPARYDSSRFPGKALADLCGKPMIVHVCERARQARGVDEVIVATDDRRIADAVRTFGGVARLTSSEHLTGTDRIAEVARDLACDIVVNPQGDEPLLDPRMIEDVVRPLLDDPAVSMTTLRRPIVDPADYFNPHVVKVTVDAAGDALYFSRAAIPAAGAPGAGPDMPPCNAHIGLYAFRREFLLRFAALPRTPLERIESLEQLRALEHGYRIRTVLTQHATVGVDTPEDLERAREYLDVLNGRSLYK